MNKEKWTYETDVNSDIWKGDVCDTKEEAIREAKSEAIERELSSFKIGIVESVSNFGIDVDQVIENIKCAMDDEVGEVSDDYLTCIDTEHLSELEEQLNDVFYKWQEKYHLKPDFYKVISEEVMKV